jgi:hypothetical protein
MVTAAVPSQNAGNQSGNKHGEKLIGTIGAGKSRWRRTSLAAHCPLVAQPF